MTLHNTTTLIMWGAKFAGAVAGSAISVVYLLPHGRREAAVRFVTGLVTGLVFGTPAGLALAEHLGVGRLLSPGEVAMMGSAAASLCAWWALGILSRFADQVFRTRSDASQDRSGR
ncbi:DUF6107 family protein [Consotaella aegiceratis]|uniref:DUF6107 family protein n=1 Tax=Consotaella aegiceratis TaxID=3097961 RepID=UPI002F3FF3BD